MTINQTVPEPRSQLSDPANGSARFSTKFVLVYSQKGGVGKTAVAMNMGACLSVTMSPDRPDQLPVGVVSIDEQNTPADYVEGANNAGYRLPIETYRMDRDPREILGLKGLHQYVFIDAGGHLKGNNPLEVVLGLEDPETGGRLIHSAIVPMQIWFESFKPTARTCNEVLRPREIPFCVVINNAPSDAKKELAAAEGFIDGHGWNRTPEPIPALRAMAQASSNGLTVPDFQRAYARNQGMSVMLKLASTLGYHTKPELEAVAV